MKRAERRKNSYYFPPAVERCVSSFFSGGFFLRNRKNAATATNTTKRINTISTPQRLLLTGLSTPAANVVVVSSVPCPAVAGREVSGGIVEALTVVVAFIVVGMAGSVVEVCTGVVDAAAPALTRNTSTSPAL